MISYCIDLDGSQLTLGKLIRNLPDMLLLQYEHEESCVRGGQQLLHTPFFQTLCALSCDLQLDRLSHNILASIFLQRNIKIVIFSLLKD